MLLLAIALGGYLFAWNEQRLSQLAKDERDRADRSRREAVQKADEASAISRFMIETLRSPHPSQDGRAVTVAQRLDEGLSQIDAPYPEETTAKASLLFSIGFAYDGLGLYDKASQALEHACQIRRTKLGSADPATLEADELLGDVLRSLAKYDEAIELLKSVCARRTAIQGERDPDTLTAQLSLANALLGNDDRPAAVSLFHQVYGAAADQKQDNPSLYLQAADGLATAQRAIEELSEARTVLEKAIADAEVLEPVDELNVYQLRSTLAGNLRASGNPQEALPLYQRCQTWFEKYLGPDHSTTLGNEENLAIVYTDLGDVTHGHQMLEDVYQKHLRLFGIAHRQTLISGMNVAIYLERMDRLDDSLALFETITRQMNQSLGPSNPHTLIALTEYGKALGRSGAHDKAIEILQSCIRIGESSHSLSTVELARSYLVLGLVYEMIGRYDEAIEESEHGLSMIRQEVGPEHPMTLTAMNNLAKLYASAGRDDDAIDLYREVVKSLTAVSGPTHRNTMITEFNLGTTYRDAHKSELAVPLLRSLIQRSAKAIPNDWLHYNIQFQLGRALIDTQSIDEGLVELEAAFEGMSKQFDPDQPDRIESIANQLDTIIGQLEQAGSDKVDLWRSRQTELRQQIADPNTSNGF